MKKSILLRKRLVNALKKRGTWGYRIEEKTPQRICEGSTFEYRGVITLVNGRCEVKVLVSHTEGTPLAGVINFKTAEIMLGLKYRERQKSKWNVSGYSSKTYELMVVNF